MTIETLNAIKTEIIAIDARLTTLDSKLTDAELAGVVIPATVDDALLNLSVNLQTILTWVNQAIADGGNTGEVGVMQAMLAELKAVFDKYAAVIEYMDGAAYGVSYGGASFYRLTATDPVNGNVETKDIVSATITSEQLV